MNIQTLTDKINNAIAEVEQSLFSPLREEGEKVHGLWLSPTQYSQATTNKVKNNAFYSNVFARNSDTDLGTDVGYCVENSTRIACLNYNVNAEKSDVVAEYDSASDTCVFADSWYQTRCEFMGGYWENAVCYIGKNRI